MKRTLTACTITLLTLLPLSATWLARAQTTAPSTPPDQARADALASLRTSAERMDKYLDDIADIRPKTPEFLSLRMKWKKRVLQAQLLQSSTPADRDNLLTCYANTICVMRQTFRNGTHEGPTGFEFECDYALAEVDYYRATHHWPFVDD